jgi:hypothetical protein
MKSHLVFWPPTRKTGTGRRAIARSRLDRRVAALEQEVREMAAPVVVIYDRERGIGTVPENLKRYYGSRGSSGTAESDPSRSAS